MQENIQSSETCKTKKQLNNRALHLMDPYLGFVWIKEAVRLSQLLIGPPLLLHLPALLDELAHRRKNRKIRPKGPETHKP